MKKQLLVIATASVMAISVCACSHEHLFGDWQVKEEATCTEEGIEERKCEKCDETETQEIAALGHDFGPWRITKEAACTEEGQEERKCERCDETESRAIPSGEHEFGEWENIKEASCTEDGEQQRTCSICGETETEVIKATGHEFEEATKTRPKTCKKCGETEGEALTTVVAVGSEATSDTYSFVLNDAYYTHEIPGAVTGNWYVLSFSFSNLADPLSLYDRSTWTGRFPESEMNILYGDNIDYPGYFYIPSREIGSNDIQELIIMYDLADVVYNDPDPAKEMYALFTIDGDEYSFIINEGENRIEDIAEDSSEMTDINTEESISVGDVRSDGNNFKFTVDSVFFSNQVEEVDNSIVYDSREGHFLVIKLHFTNLSDETFESEKSSLIKDMSVQFGDSKFRGSAVCVRNRYIVPLDSDNLYIMYDIDPGLYEDRSMPITATFTIDGAEFTIDCNANM